MNLKGAEAGRGCGIFKWLLVLGCCSMIPGAMLRALLSNLDQLEHRKQQIEQRLAVKSAEHLALTRSLVAVAGEELQRIEPAVEAGSPLQRRLLELRQNQHACLTKLASGAALRADSEVASLLRQLSELCSADSFELRILREQLQSIQKELSGLSDGTEREAVNAVCEEILKLQGEWEQRRLPAAAGELKLAAGSLLVRSLELRQRLSAPEVPCEDLLARAGGLVVAEQAIVEQSVELQQRREEVMERREQRLREAEHLECVRLEFRQQQERLQQLRVELAELQRRRQSVDQQRQQRQQLEQSTAEVRREVDREGELLRLATELLSQEILADVAGDRTRGEL